MYSMLLPLEWVDQRAGANRGVATFVAGSELCKMCSNPQHSRKA